jgi:hypothetical protein
MNKAQPITRRTFLSQILRASAATAVTFSGLEILAQTADTTSGHIGAFTKTSEAPVPLIDNTIVHYDRYVYSIGGSQSENKVLWTKLKNQLPRRWWKKRNNMPHGSDTHRACAYNYNLYIIGGRAGEWRSPIWSVDGSIKGTPPYWIPQERMPHKELFALAQYGPHIYAIGNRSGGLDGTVLHSSVDSEGNLNPWTEIEPLLIEVGQGRAIVINDYIYHLGGVTNNGRTNKVYVAHIEEDGSLGRWEETLPFDIARSGFGAVAKENRIYIAGGQDPIRGTGSEMIDSIQFADVGTDGHIQQWTETQPLPLPMQGYGLIATEDYLHVIGGQDNSATYKFVLSAPFL